MTKTAMIIGNTYRLTSKFYAFGSDVLTDCDGDVTLRIYSSEQTNILPSINATPASISTITTTADLTGSVHVGDILLITIEGTIQTETVAAITSSLITVAGVPLSGTITAIVTAHTQVGSDATAARDSTGTYHADYTAIATGYTWKMSGLMGGKPAIDTGILTPVIAKS
mgnify:CR=1 FL=1